MNKKLIVVAIAVLLICVGLSGCNEKEFTSRGEGLTITNFTDSEIHIVYEVESSHWSVNGVTDISKGRENFIEYFSSPPESDKNINITVTASYNDTGISDTEIMRLGGGLGSYSFKVYGMRYGDTPSIDIKG